MKNIVLFKKIPRENKVAYLISLGMGVGMGVLMGAIRSSFFDTSWSYTESSIPTFIMVAPITIATIILLLILSKWFSVVREDIKIKLKCIALMSIIYIYIYTIYDVIVLNQEAVLFFIANPLKIIAAFIMPLFLYFLGITVMLFDPTVSLFSPLIYSGIFIVIIAYLATKGITNLRRRIISSFLIGLFIYMIAIFPFIMSYMSSW